MGAVPPTDNARRVREQRKAGERERAAATDPGISSMRSKPAEGPALSIRRLLGMAGVTLLLTLIAYVPAMRAGFVWDDDDFLTKNAIIHAKDGLYRFWFTTEAPDYFPLVSSSL